ncbi:MAG: SurA N-terminal domain-containing protein [Ardenticatenales bacterium]
MARRKHAERAAAEAMKARREYYQHIRMNRQRRQFLYAFGPILLIVVGMLGYAFYNFKYYQPRQPVARVSGQAIPASVFSQRVQYARRQVLNNVSQLMGMIQTDSNDFVTNYATQQRTGVVQSTLDALIDEVLIKKEAETRGLTVSDQEVHDEICRQLQQATKVTSPNDATATAKASGEGDAGASDAVTNTVASDATGATSATGAITGTTMLTATDAAAATSGVTLTSGMTDTQATTTEATTTEATTSTTGAASSGGADAAGASPVPSPTPKPDCTMSEVEFDRAFTELYLPALTEATMTRETYDNLVRMNLFREALTAKLGEEVESTASQVEAQYLAFGSDAAAAGQAALADAKGGASWDALVAKYGPRAIDDQTAGSPTTGLTETVTSGSTTATFQNAGATDAVSSTGAAGATDAVTGTDATTDTAKASPPTAVPAPTAIPNPYAASKSESATWYTTATMKTELGFNDADVDKVFAVAAGKPGEELVKGSQGSYLVIVTNKDAKRPLSADELKTKRDSALEDWLKAMRSEKSAEINRFPLDTLTPPEPQWYIDGFDRILQKAPSQPTLDLNSMLTPGAPTAPTAAP